jgi:hypothetical protein
VDIIPHPATLKKREKELIEIESEIALRACRVYSMELELERLIKESTSRKRTATLRSFTIFSLGVVLGYLVFLFSS